MSSENGRAGGAADGAPPEQLALVREAVRKAKVPKAKPRTWRGAALAKELPVARVVVDKGVLHLDRYFDYAVPEELDEIARPGVRVRVRFGAGGRNVRDGRREGGSLIDGFIVDRVAESDYAGPLAALAQVVSPEPVLGADLLGLARAVADRYAGSLADVLQLAVPPRHARAEAAVMPGPPPPPAAPDPGTWTRYVRGAEFLGALASGGAPRAVWTALPGPQWAEEIARAVQATLASGRGALVVVPAGRPAARVDAALTDLLGEGRHALLTADAGQERRYREWLAVRRGAVRAVVGTRAAMFAPVRDLGLVVVCDIVQTLLLNMFYGGKLKGMPPKLQSDDGKNIVIRPLAYVKETDLEKYAELREFPIIPCNLCGSQPNLKRAEMKALIREWDKRFPGRVENMFNALAKVVPSHLMDTTLYPFQ
ncbi:hypothetical protein ABZS63_29880, partial [Streptomyces sp. NPDC005568]